MSSSGLAKEVVNHHSPLGIGFVEKGLKMAKKSKRKTVRTVDPTPLFKVGDHIKHPRYGKGVIKKIADGMFPDYDFFYDADFTIKGGDGTKVWLPKAKTEKTALLLSRDGQPWDNAPACEGTGPSCPATCFGPFDCPLCK